MHITLKNLGKLQEATIDTTKDLTILVGPNNTSKTYAAHALYGFHKNFLQNYIDALRQCVSAKHSNNPQATLPLSISLDIFEKEYLPEILNRIQITYQSQLPDVFATQDEAFAKTQVQFSLPAASIAQIRERLTDKEIDRTINLPEGNIRIRKHKKSTTWEFERITDHHTTRASIPGEIQQKQLSLLETAYLNVAMDFIVSGDSQYHNPFILTAERAAIQLFSKELMLGRATLVDSMLSIIAGSHSASKLESSLATALKSSARRYPLAIRDSIFIAENLSRHGKTTSSFASIADSLDSEMIGGKFRITATNEVFFRPETRGSEISLPLTSSSVKSLAGLSLYLRHIASPGDFLIIDEPELNLHPDNQRRIARLLVRLSRSGIRVLVSTHSDYIIREINNSIMLSADKSGALQRRFSYNKEETITPDQVAAYLFDGQKAHRLEIPKTGLEVETIDREINSLNEKSQEIFFSLFGGSGA